MRTPSSPSLRHWFALAGLTIVIALGVVFAVSIEGTKIDGSALAHWIDGLGVWGPAAIVGLMVVHCFVPFPAEIVALCAGVAYGTSLGTALVWTGAMIGALLSFGLARFLGRLAVERLLPERHRIALADWTEDQGAITLMISRLVPVIAFNLINYAAGLTRVGWWTFIWTTGLGILPLTTLMVYFGAHMRELSWPLLLIFSAAGIATIWALHWFLGKRGWFGRR